MVVTAPSYEIEVVGPVSGELLSPIELAPGDCSRLTAGQRAAVCFDMLNAGHKLVLAGLRRQVGPNGDVHVAYRKWNAAQLAEHDRVVDRMLRRLQTR